MRLPRVLCGWGARAGQAADGRHARHADCGGGHVLQRAGAAQRDEGAGDEYGRLLRIVQAYAIDNPGVCMSCSKGLDGSADLATQKDHSAVDVARLIYGDALARELLRVSSQDASIGLHVTGLASGASYAARRLTFLLFINKRACG